ncbi:MAG TPA: DUF475 domain-containing protein [Thermodesulfobacteriota bacterium]|nr:DUF475 domain-containing protein [Thermodesulfobacteriota bacterium]
MLEAIIVIFGLSLFEIISSIDNAVVNAHVLATMGDRFRRFFLIWGMLIAVFVLRGVLPFLIVWIANPHLSFVELFKFTFSSDSKQIESSLAESKAYLLIGGGMYLFLVFLAWLFLEEKKYTFLVEHFIHRHSVWFYAITSIFFTVIIYISLQFDPFLAFAASIGTTAFFITDGFKKNAEAKEAELLDPAMSGWSKVFYLEVLDASFSIDGVIGAFAFTMSVPLILIGNGIGAFVVREVTVRGINWISKYAYLKNGAMYSIGMLGAIMILESFGEEIPFWIAPLNTVILLAIFLFLSWREIKLAEKLEAEGKGGAA